MRLSNVDYVSRQWGIFSSNVGKDKICKMRNDEYYFTNLKLIVSYESYVMSGVLRKIWELV